MQWSGKLGPELEVKMFGLRSVQDGHLALTKQYIESKSRCNNQMITYHNVSNGILYPLQQQPCC